jgi:hypothetical protein
LIFIKILIKDDNPLVAVERIGDKWDRQKDKLDVQTDEQSEKCRVIERYGIKRKE